MSTIALNSAMTGLKAAQMALNTVSTNISNASTPGYTRKILPTETLIVAGTGAGVQINNLFRKVDASLMRDLMRQVSVVQSSKVRESYLSAIQDFHGASESGRAVSAKMANLQSAFTALTSTPEDSLRQQQTLLAAQDLVRTFNDFTRKITESRTQADQQIAANISDVNQNLKTIEDLNLKIKQLKAEGGSTADLEDLRDNALRNISQHLEVSHYIADDYKLVVMTKQGQTLVDDKARQLVFDSNVLTATAYYPGGGASGIYIDSVSGFEITNDRLGGSIGALIELRDVTLPTYQAQMDELAQKTAERFNNAGLRLFVDHNGLVPPSVAPPTPVGYTGFAGTIRVNPAIVADPSLLRAGTSGTPSQPGSSDVLQRVNDFVFGAYQMQRVDGTADLSAGTIFAAGVPPMTQINTLHGTVNLHQYVPNLDEAPNLGALPLPGTFDLTIGGVTNTITINAGDTGTDLVNSINAAFPGAAALNSLGQLSFNATQDIAIAHGTLGAAELGDIGLTAGTYPAHNPSFRVQVGAQAAVTIEILPTDTQVELLAKLNAVPGLTAYLDVGGELVMTPDEGGALSIADVTGTPVASMGLTTSGVAHTALRQSNMGPGGTLSSGLLAYSTLGDYARSIISAHAEDHSKVSYEIQQEDTYLSILEQRQSDGSGVDIDRELAELIRIQTAYTAAARMVTASEQLLDELMNSIR